MAYSDINIPVIERITLPSGNTYYIADREIRDVVDALSQTITGGVSYNVVWDGNAIPIVANVPAGVSITYNDTVYTGTLAADNATPGTFYLIKSTTQVDSKDIYDEYVPVGTNGNKTWEKIGDTQIDLTDVIKNVTLSKQIDTVIGSEATFMTSDAVSSITPITKKLATTTIVGIDGSTTPSVVQNRTLQTTANGAGIASSTNTDWLKGVSVSNGVLTIGAATMDTQTTYSADAPTTITIPTAAEATAVATGEITTAGEGADIVTDVEIGNTIEAVTGWSDQDTVSVLTDMTDISITKGNN